MSEEKQTRPQAEKNKPVVVYIMILFIAAFLLMALSFLMHQRSNTEALGQLQNSVTAMQEVQATQEKNIELQDQLSKAENELEKTITAYDGQLKALAGDLEQKQLELDAMMNLHLLQQTFNAGNYESCQEIIRFMEANQQVSALEHAAAAPEESPEGTILSPLDLFYQLKDAATVPPAQAEPAPSE